MDPQQLSAIAANGNAKAVRIGFCIECGKHFFAANKRGKKRKFCALKCKDDYHNRLKSKVETR